MPTKRRGWGLLYGLGLLALVLLLRSDSDPVAGALFGLVATLFLTEFTTKAVPIARALAKAASWTLPPAERGRFYGEWAADLEDPQHVDRPVNYALDLLIGTPRLAWELWGRAALATHDDEERRSPIAALGVTSLLITAGVVGASVVWSMVGVPLTPEDPDDWLLIGCAGLGTLGLGGFGVVRARRPGRALDARNLTVVLILAGVMQAALSGASILIADQLFLGVGAAAVLVGAVGAGSEVVWSIGIGRYRSRDAVVQALCMWVVLIGTAAALGGADQQLLAGAGLGVVVSTLSTVGILSMSRRTGVTTWLLVPEFDTCLLQEMGPGEPRRARLFFAWTPEFHRPALMLDAPGLPIGPITTPQQVELIQEMIAAVPLLPRTRSSFYGALASVSGIVSLRSALREHFGSADDPDVARLAEKCLG